MKTANKQQRTGPSRGGEPRGACSIHSSAAYDKAQSRARLRPVGVPRSMIAGRCISSPVRTWAGLHRSAHFSHFPRGAFQGCPCRDANLKPVVAHRLGLSRVRGFDDHELREAQAQNVGISIQPKSRAQ